jgi:hypothetical protein
MNSPLQVPRMRAAARRVKAGGERFLGGVLAGATARRLQIRAFADEWAADNLDARQSTGPLWIVLGDSISQGIGATTREASYVGVMHELLRRRDAWRVINLSRSEAGVLDVLARQLPELASITAKEPAALVTCLIGAEDLVRRTPGLDTALRQVVAALPVGSVIGTLPHGSRMAAQMNGVIREEAERHAMRLAVLPPRLTGPLRGRDARGLGDVGHAGWARAVLAAADGPPLVAAPPTDPNLPIVPPLDTSPPTDPNLPIVPPLDATVDPAGTVDPAAETDRMVAPVESGAVADAVDVNADQDESVVAVDEPAVEPVAEEPVDPADSVEDPVDAEVASGAVLPSAEPDEPVEPAVQDVVVVVEPGSDPEVVAEVVAVAEETVEGDDVTPGATVVTFEEEVVAVAEPDEDLEVEIEITREPTPSANDEVSLFEEPQQHGGNGSGNGNGNGVPAGDPVQERAER